MTSEFHDAIWERIDDVARAPDAELAARAERFAAGAAAALDLGCGDGIYLPALGAGAGEVAGVDRSAVALKRAARRLPAARLELVGPSERLPLDDNCVDRVWLCDTLEHVVDTQVVLSEARRVLTPGGRVLVVAPDHRFATRIRLAFAGWERHFDPFADHLRFYTARSLADALSDCGFALAERARQRGRLVFEASRP